MPSTGVEEAVREAYAVGADYHVEDLCCPVDYDPLYLEAIPDEVIELDYGCGDPSRYLQRGDATVQGVAEPGAFPVRRSDVLPRGDRRQSARLRRIATLSAGVS